MDARLCKKSQRIQERFYCHNENCLWYDKVNGLDFKKTSERWKFYSFV